MVLLWAATGELFRRLLYRIEVLRRVLWKLHHEGAACEGC